MPLLLRLVVVACLLINCVDCEFVGNNATTNTASDYETTRTLSEENYTKDYVSTTKESTDGADSDFTTAEYATQEFNGSWETFEERSTISYTKESTDEADTDLTTPDYVTEELNGSSELFEERSTISYTTESTDEADTDLTTPDYVTEELKRSSESFEERSTISYTKPGEVTNLKINNETENQLIAIWNPPESPSFVKNYRVVLKEPNTNTKPIENISSETSYTFSRLESCSTYTISVAAVSGNGDQGDFKERSANTIEPATINAVKTPKQQYENGKIFLTWAPPENQEKCIDHYLLNIDGKNVVEKNLVYIHNGVIGCKTYSSEIVAISKTGKKSKTGFKYTIPPIIPKAPSIESIKGKEEKTKASFIILPEGSTENNCKLLLVKVICLAENNSQPWVIQYRTVQKNLTDYKTEKGIQIDIDGLSEYTIYSCTSQLENIAGWSSPSTPAKVFTKEEVPTKPLEFIYININSTAFELKWVPPYKIPGKLNNYKLVIEPMHSLHFEIKNCKESPEKITKILLAETTKYVFDKAVPDFRYKCSLQAKTTDFGDYVSLELDTLSGVPDPPSQVTVKTEVLRTPIYNASAKIQWTFPCKTKGIVNYFVLRLMAESLEQSNKDQLQVFVPPQENTETYNYVFSNLIPLHEYKVQIKTVLIAGNVSEEISSRKFNSPDGFPSEPMNIELKYLSLTSFYITWKPPVNKNGNLSEYTLNISSLGPKHEVPIECDIDLTEYKHNVPADQNSYIFENARPNYKYEIIITANTETTTGYSSAPFLHETYRNRSEAVRNLNYDVNFVQSEKYNSSVTITFEKPCNINGPLAYYEVSLVGKSNNENEEHVVRTVDYTLSFTLKPAVEYEISTVVVTNCFPYCSSEPTKEHFSSPAGVPPIITNSSKPVLQNIQENVVTVILNKDLFGEDYGEIMYYAILLTGSEVYNSSDNNYGFWNSEKWPNLGTWNNETDYVETYQATPNNWNPFNKRNDRMNTDEVAEFVLGTGNCTNLDEYCNGPLRPDTKYYMEIRAFTKDAYRNSEAMTFNTLQIEDLEKASVAVKIIGIVVGVLAFIILCGIIIFVWRRKHSKTMDDDIDEEDIQYRPIQLKQFPSHYKELKDKELLLKNEFMFLNAMSADVALPMSEALLTENRKKNRYINVLPYDDIRVVLDDDMSSYINASYIKGYSNRVEYIATQGPLKSTNLDFWKMILQENVTVIVMVAQFIEQEKEKCYKYVPDDPDPVDIGEDIRIRCAATLDFKSHCERHIKIQTADRKHEVTHLQFLNWPDFGCPTGTENMLNFCRIMRSHVKEDPGIIVVHCSAGVGRTGTLIAVDILLQTMSKGQDIDVFNTVLKLRKQRKSMVQTQAQYDYIYTCLYDAMMDPPPFEEIKAYEPVYENLRNGMGMKVLKSDNNENIETKL